MKKVLYISFYFCMLSLISCNSSTSTSIKLMSYNIRHGEGLDQKLDLDRIGSIISRQKPNFCALQEVDQKCERSNNIEQTNYLAQMTKMVGTFGKFMDYQSGEYGMATLSAKPIVSSKVLKLPNAVHEPRCAIIQEIEISKSCTLTIANVHLDWLGTEQGIARRKKQITVLLKEIEKLDNSTIILGDFNCTPNSPTMNFLYSKGYSFCKKGSDHLSFQGESKVELDHLIYKEKKGTKISLKNIQLLKEPIASDHRPLVVELEIEN